MFEMTDPVAARRAAIAAEKERLARERERRRSRGAVGANGFAQRKWRWLGVNGAEAIQAVTELLKDIAQQAALTDEQRDMIGQGLGGAPDREGLLPAVRAGLALLEPEAVLRHMRELWSAEVRWLNEPGLERCRVLCSTAPGVEIRAISRAY
ncbi:hypothetical protein [Streptomyces sp. NPDC085596]|uniref:hypothetical protein n=1 Tax=Streptomyces sp. NPDC085596 TaxID=3365731 RepID=UPI0037D00D8E